MNLPSHVPDCTSWPTDVDFWQLPDFLAAHPMVRMGALLCAAKHMKQGTDVAEAEGRKYLANILQDPEWLPQKLEAGNDRLLRLLEKAPEDRHRPIMFFHLLSLF